MTDTKSPKLVKKLRSYEAAVDKVVKEMEKSDHDLSLSISLGAKEDN